MNEDTDNRQSSADRPVWSHKTEGGYLEDFLRGEAAGTDESAETADAESGALPAGAASDDSLRDKVIAAIRQIFDPEIPVNIYDLGLIYGVETDAENNVDVTMTLTTPHCPVAESLPMEVETRVRSVEGVNDVDLDVVWDPPWDMSKMSEEARLELGLL